MGAAFIWLGACARAPHWSTPRPSSTPPPHTSATTTPDADALDPASSTVASPEDALPPFRPGDGSETVPVFQAPAQDAIAVGDVAVLLEADFLHLVAIDVHTGKRRWRRKLRPQTTGRHTLHRHQDRVILRADSELYVFGARDGKLHAELHDVYGALVERRGGCAYEARCHAWLCDCLTGTKQGKPHSGTAVHIYRRDGGPHDIRCKFNPHVLGRSGSVVVARVEAKSSSHTPSPMGQPPPALAGFDASTGRQIYRTAALGQGQVITEVVPAHGICWVADAHGGKLSGLDCATAKTLWARPFAPARDLEDELDVREPDDRSLLVLRPGKSQTLVQLVDLKTGALRWRVRLAADERPLLRGEQVELIYGEADYDYAVLDPATGARVGGFHVPEDQHLRSDPAGGFVLLGSPTVEIDPQGKIRRTLQLDTNGPVYLTATHLVHAHSNALVVRQRSSLAVIQRLPPGTIVSESSDALPPGMVLLFRQPPGGARQGTPGQAMLMRLPATAQVLRGDGSRESVAGELTVGLEPVLVEAE